MRGKGGWWSNFLVLGTAPDVCVVLGTAPDVSVGLGAVRLMGCGFMAGFTFLTPGGLKELLETPCLQLLRSNATSVI